MTRQVKLTIGKPPAEIVGRAGEPLLLEGLEMGRRLKTIRRKEQTMTRQIRNMKYKLTPGVLLWALLGVGLISCSGDDDCPNCPNEAEDKVYEGRVYVSMIGGPPSIAVFDAASDSLLDSLIIDPERSFSNLKVTSDGRYLLFWWDGDARYPQILIYDAVTLTQTGLLDQVAFFELVRNETELFGSAGSRTSRFRLFSFPDLQVLRERSYPQYTLTRTLYAKDEGVVYGVGRFPRIDDPHDTTEVAIIELDSLSITRRIRITDEDNIPYWIRRVCLDFDTGVGHALAMYLDGEFYLRFDLATGKVKSRYQLAGSYGDVEISPDGSEVFVSDPGNPGLWIPRLPGPIRIFDAVTGSLKGEISTVDFLEEPGAKALDVWRLDFSPDGSTLYASTGNLVIRPGTVIKYDAEKREFLKLLFPMIDHYPYNVGVGPTPE